MKAPSSRLTQWLPTLRAAAMLPLAEIVTKPPTTSDSCD